MMVTKVAISFDDGIIEQFEWAEELYKRNIVGTFYINPSLVGFRGVLNMGQLRKMHDGMHHTIANHLWKHEAPSDGVMLSVAVKSLLKTKAWLEDRGFGDGKDLVALPYGSAGGEWLEHEILGLLEHCSQVRDVTTTGVNDVRESKYVGACEKSIFTFVKGKNILHYFHGHHNTSTDNFVSFLDSLVNYDVTMTSMREIADSKLNVCLGDKKHGDTECAKKSG